jgi:hypothetical protein
MAFLNEKQSEELLKVNYLANISLGLFMIVALLLFIAYRLVAY